MTAATKEAPQAAGCHTDENSHRRFLDLEVSLRNAQVLASLLAKIVEGTERWPSFSKMELTLAIEQIEYLVEPLKEAIDHMDTIYHNRPKEEAAR
jgi:hypothetical protein